MSSAQKEAMLNDLRNNPATWFNYFSCNNPQGMDKNQVIHAMTTTFATDPSSINSYMNSVWPVIDPDLSGRITIQEFLNPGGLREMILAQFMPKPGPSAAGYPSAPSAPQQNIHCGRCRQLFSYSSPAPGQRNAVVCCPFCQSHNQINLGPDPTPMGQGQGFGAPPSDFWTQAPTPSNPPMATVNTSSFQPSQQSFQTPPQSFQPSRPGRKKALLIGVNYRGTKAELRGCVNDVDTIRQLLTQTYGWPASCMHVLVDDGSTAPPTRSGILQELQWLSHDAQPGDVLFLHFSGHGAQKEDPHGYEEDGMNETILPVDFQRAGMITDDEISNIVVKPLPNGCKLISVMDCCHSGTGLDLPFQWQSGNWKEETNPYFCQADVQMFSGCMDEGCSADVASSHSRPGGAMTTAFTQALQRNPAPSYNELMRSLLTHMQRGGFEQRPNLTSSQRFDPNRLFVFDDIIPNSNQKLGRVFRRKFPPRPRNDPVMNDILGMAGMAAAAVGGYMIMDAIGLF
mmetsp:Transcript_2494/g.2630  ORF Transcript_2494/g.2630 Transcript_2494/m.2630 type:complete len:512 (+) Transcript_2494:95-1630(+)